MNLFKEQLKIWNRNFKKGLTVYQMFLSVFMIIGAFIGNNILILFCMFHVLIGYFEQRQWRWGL